jgi:hypothetical protein
VNLSESLAKDLTKSAVAVELNSHQKPNANSAFQHKANVFDLKAESYAPKLTDRGLNSLWCHQVCTETHDEPVYRGERWALLPCAASPKLTKHALAFIMKNANTTYGATISYLAPAKQANPPIFGMRFSLLQSNLTASSIMVSSTGLKPTPRDYAKKLKLKTGATA